MSLGVGVRTLFHSINSNTRMATAPRRLPMWPRRQDQRAGAWSRGLSRRVLGAGNLRAQDRLGGPVMTIPRRRFLHLAAGAAALPVVPRIARAQAYPTRPVRIIVGVPPGGSSDIITRLMGQWLSERLRQPFIVDNRPGATGNIGKIGRASCRESGQNSVGEAAHKATQ